MASFFSTVRQGFGRQANRGTNPPNKGNGSQQPSPSPPSYSSTSLPLPSHLGQSPLSPSAPMSAESGQGLEPQVPITRKPPFFFRDEYSGLIVKGNFMTLAAKPVHVEEGEWLAHQVVEQYRLLDGMIQIIRAVDERTGVPICNPQSCPTMSAAGHTYTWLDNNKNPIRIPAFQYISLVQKWIMGKISDQSLFPTDTTFSNPSSYQSSGAITPGASTPIPAGPTTLNAPLAALAGRDWLGKSSGFPENFEGDIRNIYRQMMRCYAHLYHGHWLDPFWHINAYKELNTCFIHFVNVGKLFGLLGDKEMEPMLPLIDLWVAKGLLPAAHQGGRAEDATPTPSSAGGNLQNAMAA